jgi:transcriptional regulator with XRE-family HTH domain
MKEVFGRRLQSERVLAGKSRKEIADYLGVSLTTISYYETGVNYPAVEILLKLADLYDVSIDYLLGRTEEKKIN